MNVGVVGLGLIGGSAAKAFKAAGHTVYGYDIDKAILGYGCLDGTIDHEMTEKNVRKCDVILLTATPQAVIGHIEKNAEHFSPDTLVIDFCGTKREVCAAGFEAARRYGFTYVGGHPMAGLQYSGYKYSRATLFNNASIIVVPPTYDDIALLDRVKQSLSPLGFKKYIVTTADFHDRMIAYTSQMCHLVSNAFVKSPSAQYHKGYSAGSFRDFTRVARLNEAMWTELFLENSDSLLSELDELLTHLHQYRDAIAEGDAERLCALLREGREAKEAIE